MVREARGKPESGPRWHKDLEVRQAAVRLARDIYAATRHLPSEERFGLSAQLRRSAVSIASNIAEGAARQGTKEFVQFLYVAAGSASELDTQLEIAKGLPAASDLDLNGLQSQVESVAKMLRAMIRSLKA